MSVFRRGYQIQKGALLDELNSSDEEESESEEEGGGQNDEEESESEIDQVYH